MTNFETLDVSKRERIINAAMDEFRYGYKKASTDAIVRKAGISKGLLFHYFDSKKNLYKYLLNFAVEMIQKEYSGLIGQSEGRDTIETVLRFAGAHENLLKNFPHVYSFLNGLYVNTEDSIGADMWALYTQKKTAMMQQMYEWCDTSVFKDGIDPKMAIDIICWTMDGFFNNKFEENQDYFEPLKKYLEILRKHFYK